LENNFPKNKFQKTNMTFIKNISDHIIKAISQVKSREHVSAGEKKHDFLISEKNNKGDI
jgi:hypothetical protein